MPLIDAQPTLSAAEVGGPSESGQYLVFYSSRDAEGIMWCPDCRDVEELVKRTFEAPDSPTAQIVYVGQRVEWKTPSNAFRSEPWHLNAIPTIVKLNAKGEEQGRLVESEVEDKLTGFVEL